MGLDDWPSNFGKNPDKSAFIGTIGFKGCGTDSQINFRSSIDRLCRVYCKTWLKLWNAISLTLQMPVNIIKITKNMFAKTNYLVIQKTLLRFGPSNTTT